MTNYFGNQGKPDKKVFNGLVGEPPKSTKITLARLLRRAGLNKRPPSGVDIPIKVKSSALGFITKKIN